MRPFHSCSLLALLALIAVPAWAIQLTEKRPPETKPARSGACYLAVLWSDKVTYLPDPTRGGAPGPGLTGRVYLFGPQILLPIKADGSLVVELFNPAQRGPDGQPRLMEKWILNPEQLQKLERSDMIGCGYHLFLPWGTYRPDLPQIRLRTVYQPKNGGPLHCDSGLIRLKRESGSSSVLAHQERDPLLASSDPLLTAQTRKKLRLVIMASLPPAKLAAYPSGDRDLAYLLRKRIEHQLQDRPIQVQVVPVKQVYRALAPRKPLKKSLSPLDIGRRFKADLVVHLEVRSAYEAGQRRGDTQTRLTLGLLLTVLDAHHPEEDPIQEEALTASVPTPDALADGEDWLLARRLFEEAARVAAARVAIQPVP
jgi:hypothetical protein